MLVAFVGLVTFAVGWAANYFLCRQIFLRQYAELQKEVAHEVAEQAFLTDEATEQKEKALELTDEYEAKAVAAAERAEKASKELAKHLSEQAEQQVPGVVREAIDESIKEAMEDYGKIAEQARADAEAAVQSLSEYKQEWAASGARHREEMALAEERIRQDFIEKRPEPCQECKGIGYTVRGKRPKRHDCKHCDEGVIYRAVALNPED